MNKSLFCLSVLCGLLMYSPVSHAFKFNWRHPFDMGEEEPPPPPPKKVDNSVQSEPLPPPPPLPKPVHYEHKPMIAIVIDDVGVDLNRSEWATELPPAVTLSYLPYAPKIGRQVAAAKERGHEIILHMPMEAENRKENPGPHHLATGMTKDELEKNIAASLDAFQGYVGVNNHMGSKFTANRAGLDLFMAALEKRHVFFLDSRTTPQTIAEQVAREHHLPATHRDVFIDHASTAEFVAAALNHAEDIARLTGSAIVIGHPKDVTLASLEVWLAQLGERGIKAVPLSEVVAYRMQHPDNK